MSDFKGSSEELFRLRAMVANLESEVDSLRNIEKHKQEVEHSLGERVKELNCLYTMSQLIEKYIDDFPRFIQGVSDLLPVSWQYPEITCGRVVFEDYEATSMGFRTSRWKQVSNIYVSGNCVGSVEVYYLSSMPDVFEGPFLKEERLLIDAVAERVGLTAERLNAKRQIELEQESLKSTNIALREVLSKVQDEKKEVADAVQANINKIIFPIIYALESELPGKLREHVNLLKSNLEEVASPFINKLSKNFLSLTPVELSVCNMIRKGLSSKEIAKLRGVSPATVNRHREHVRKKLGLVNQDINLVTYLETYMES